MPFWTAPTWATAALPSCSRICEHFSQKRSQRASCSPASSSRGCPRRWRTPSWPLASKTLKRWPPWRTACLTGPPPFPSPPSQASIPAAGTMCRQLTASSAGTTAAAAGPRDRRTADPAALRTDAQPHQAPACRGTSSRRTGPPPSG